MGYTVSGFLSVTTNDTIDATLALQAGVPDFLRAHIEDYNGDVVSAILFGYMDCEESEHVVVDGARFISVDFNNKWHILGDEAALRWLVEQGAGLRAELTGEDDYSWSYNVELNSGVLEEISLVKVPVDDVALVPLIQEVRDVVQNLDVDSLDIPADLAAVLKRFTV